MDRWMREFVPGVDMVCAMVRTRKTKVWIIRRTSYFIVAVATVLVLAVVITNTKLNPTRPDRPVIIATSDWAPYVGRDLPADGPLAEILRQVLASQGYDATVEYTSWDLALKRVDSGQALAAFPLVASEARADEFLASDPLVQFVYVLFYDTTRPPPVVNAPEDLRELRVARITGYDYWPELDHAVGTYVDYLSSAEAFRALAADEVDLVVEGNLAGQAVLSSSEVPLDGARFRVLEGEHPLLSSAQALHLFVAQDRASEDFLEGFNQALAEFQYTEAHNQLMRDLQTPSGARDVALVGVEDELPTLMDSTGRPVATLPRGSRAAVLSWPEGTGHGEVPPADLTVEVKVLDGPGQGRVGFVNLAELELVQ